ncbi:hypothetical protein FPRO04_14191 [Fusarium proliferatum]|nr:hypothetical protein FPRO04_14191 [Fusarium proliferatum]
MERHFWHQGLCEALMSIWIVFTIDSGANVTFGADKKVQAVSTFAPQLLAADCQNSNVPLSLLPKGPSGEKIPRIPVGTSEYLKASGDESTRPTTMLESEGVETASTIDHPSIPPKGEPRLPSDSGQNTYESFGDIFYILL